MRRNRRDLTGLTGAYGKWTILSPIDTDRHGTYYLCQCECGKRQEIKAVNLVDGKTTSCGKFPCRSRHVIGIAKGDLTASIWCRIKRSAEVRRYKMKLTQQQAWLLFQRQEGKCALTGLPIQLHNKNALCTASLDRIDPTKQYTRANVQWVHKDVNMMKRSLSQERFIELCRAVATHTTKLTRRPGTTRPGRGAGCAVA